MPKIPGYNNNHKDKYSIYKSNIYHPEVFDLVNHYWHNDDPEEDTKQSNEPTE
ncbi:hypothetical protein PRVXT_001511 [Proteinivorax tanatarense]|uniref:Uncharacterized protein n=1 Tax=Proteinivorax tanatarense TaxID=1260629 RepID=A0AAU7VQV4_9FIRM